jgi:uncharacterized membrane protein
MARDSAPLRDCVAGARGQGVRMPSDDQPRVSRPWQVGSVVLALVFVAVLGSLAVLRHRTLHSHAFDLGQYHQIVWTTSRGHFFETSYKSTIENGLRHHLGDHVELILLGIAPLLHVYSGAETLVVVQAVVLGLTGVVLFLFATAVGTGAPAALFLQLLFYLHPAIQGPALFDFHPLVLAPAGLAAALLAAEKDRWWAFWIAVAVALSCREQVALSAAALAVFVLVRKRRPLAAASLVVVAAVWLQLSVGVVIPRLHPDGEAKHFVAKFGHLGATPTEAVTHLLASPRLTLQRLTEEGRLAYIAQVLRHSGGPMFLLAPEVAVVAAPELAINLLSREGAQRVIFWQYASSVATFLVAATALAAVRVRRLAERFGAVRWARHLPLAIASAACLWSLWGHQRAFQGLYLVSPGARSDYAADGRGEAARRVFAQIPPTASLAAQSDLAPHLSRRREMYVFPWMPEVEYIVLDALGETFPLSSEDHRGRLAALREDPSFEIVVEEDGFVLFRRRAGRPRGPS